MSIPVGRIAPIKLEPYIDPEFARTLALQFQPNLVVPRGSVVGQVASVNARQTVTLTNTPTGGTFTLTYGGDTTAPIAYNATAATVIAALALLASVPAGSLSATGGAGGPYVIDYVGALAGTAVPAITGTGTSLTGAGAQPAVAVAQTKTGSATGLAGLYASGNTDGTQNPIGLNVYDFVTDANGYVILGLTGSTVDLNRGADQNAEVYWRGSFKVPDLNGLDANAITAFGARIYGQGAGAAQWIYIP